MISTQELKATVSELSPDELLQFFEWFEEFMADQWDKKIEAYNEFIAGHKTIVNHFATPEFWFNYRQLPENIHYLELML